MDVRLIDYTGYGHPDPARHAANLLVFTKSTRLNMEPGLMMEIDRKPWPEVEQELQYMARTIPSSWEMIDYTFLIMGVTRAFTHQFVRTRAGSYAQQTMRVLNVEGWSYAIGPGIPPGTEKRDVYRDTMASIRQGYNTLTSLGVPEEDARGVLPTNILTNIVAKFDMRTLVGLVRARSSPRTQDEYRQVLARMKECARAVHPWLDIFIDRDRDRAAAELDSRIAALPIGSDEQRELIKLVDELRKD